MFKSIGTASAEAEVRCMFCLSPTGVDEYEADGRSLLLCEQCSTKTVEVRGKKNKENLTLRKKNK